MTAFLLAMTGFEAPHGSAAIGWRIAVYWKSNQAFYTGTVQAFDAAMSRHHVLYNSSDEEYLLLAVEHIKWLQSPPPPAARTAKVQNTTPRSRVTSKLYIASLQISHLRYQIQFLSQLPHWVRTQIALLGMQELGC